MEEEEVEGGLLGRVQWWLLALCSTDLLRAPEQSSSTHHSRRAPTAAQRRSSHWWTDTHRGTFTGGIKVPSQETQKRREEESSDGQRRGGEKWTRFCAFSRTDGTSRARCSLLSTLGAHLIIYFLPYVGLWNTTLLF